MATSPPGTAVPGTSVPSGSLLTTGGSQGPQGPASLPSANVNNLAVSGSDGLIYVPASSIWSTRLRSFNAVGNPTFEVDQRNVGSLLTNPANGTLVIDRWNTGKATATLGYSVQRQAGLVVVPGTSFAISQNFLRITLTAQQTTLAAGDFLNFTQQIEGPRWRELCNDIHSLQLLVRSSVANLKFACSVRDPGTSTQSLVKLCTIPSANTWSLLTFPNIPIWPAGNFTLATGQAAYLLAFNLACGTTFMAPATDTWQNGNFIGASGMSNFAASPVNSTFDIAYIGHEPGALCTTPIDCSFDDNYDSCLRYFQKSYSYAIAPGAASASGRRAFLVSAYPGLATANGQENYRKPLARAAQTFNIYSDISGAVGNARNVNTGADTTVSAPVNNETGISQFTIGTAATVTGVLITFHYTADTGW